MPILETKWEVYRWSPAARVWRVAAIFSDEAKAQSYRSNLRSKGYRVRVSKLSRTVADPIRTSWVKTAAQKHREARAEAMSDLADAKKYYKSPG